MKVGDLVKWSKGHCEIPGLVLETRPTKDGHPANAGGEAHEEITREAKERSSGKEG